MKIILHVFDIQTLNTTETVIAEHDNPNEIVRSDIDKDIVVTGVNVYPLLGQIMVFARREATVPPPDPS
jgi:hypothetical protein